MPQKNRLIVFLIPPEKMVNGGILSIFSIAKNSRKFESIHKAEVLISTYPGAKSYHHNNLFENNEVIHSFDEIIKRGTPDYLMLHVPEYASYDTYQGLKKHADWLAEIGDLRVNIMDQNILLMQPPTEVASWFALTPFVTQTIAHSRYATQEIANMYNLPTRHLSTFVDPGQYTWTSYKQKDNLILLSNDEVEKKPQIIDKLRTDFPNYRIITINNIAYEEYKKLITTAKFTLTFGEGFDGYYVEGFFTGGVTFAVYNDDFFPDNSFADFDNTYKSYDDMLANLVKDIQRLETDEALYNKIVKENYDKIAGIYNFNKYTDNLKRFYEGVFSFVPKAKSAEKLIGQMVLAKDETLRQSNISIAARDKTIRDMEALIASKTTLITELHSTIDIMSNSRSWRITKPLRKISSYKASRKKK